MPFWILVNLQFKNRYYKNWEIWNTIFCMFSFRQRVVWIFKVICRQMLFDGMSINWWFPQRTIWSFWANRVQNKKSPKSGKITIYPKLKKLECSFLFVSLPFSTPLSPLITVSNILNFRLPRNLAPRGPQISQNPPKMG